MMKRIEHLKTFEEETLAEIDELKHEYVDTDWEDDFDDIHEAYEEQGRGEAEAQAVMNLIRREYPDGMSDTETVALMDELAEAWGISYN
jgi:hypothetical protein